ncbi:probable cytochrome P450 6a14 [Monomorium pharaonis]|uniref:probable cytochrome P450 6a14 n=1 Tax=Monomorium pharaonis TaxID=307658 RepID=UPI0017464D1C|nr:probable cytochrome P450 6a14 [Monomorium pharaonis]XP_036139928.1 probable cytochrome P450 6a14 [Monomorium pharaonis]
MGLFEILCGIVTVIIALYYYLTSTFDFWKSRGIQGPQPIPGFGNLKDVLLAKIHLGDYVTKIYNEYKNEALIGIFSRKTPILIVKDLDLIKDVLIKDFTSFPDRGFPVTEKVEPLTQNLFNLEPKRWRPLRMKLSSVFTSGKLKEMFSLILECADCLVEYMEKIVSKSESVECRELTAKYTTDVIGSCAFGIEMNALSNKDSEFRNMGRKIFTPTWKNMLRSRLRTSFPKFYNKLGYILPQTEITKFFTRIVVETIDYRETNNVIRNDFVDKLRELKKHPDKLDDIDLTDSLIAAQAFAFFGAGFKTSSSTISNALYELALNQNIQENLRKEIDEIYMKHGKDLTYDNINEMGYLNKIFKETLRKYPPVPVLMRKSVSSYTFESPKVNISKGQTIWIPVLAIHRNPNIYPKPDVFDPERFNEEAVQSRHPMSYLPFGDGPRNCIGARFAVYQTKLGLIKILRNYKIHTCDKTPLLYVNDPKMSLLLVPKGGIHLNIIKINQT